MFHVDKAGCNRRNNIRSYSQIFETGIDKDIALCLYTAIVTDTGCFRYTNTTWKTLRIGSELLNMILILRSY